MKTTHAMATLAALLLCTALMAQQPPRQPDGRGGNRPAPGAGKNKKENVMPTRQPMAKVLDLTPAQAKKVRKIQGDYIKHQRRLIDKREKSLRKVLTPEQFQRMQRQGFGQGMSKKTYMKHSMHKRHLSSSNRAPGKKAGQKQGQKPRQQPRGEHPKQ